MVFGFEYYLYVIISPPSYVYTCFTVHMHVAVSYDNKETAVNRLILFIFSLTLSYYDNVG